MMYIKLKDRQLKRLERDHGIGGRWMFKRRVAYISGVRSQESERRMGNVNKITIEGPRVWIAPIHDWSKLDTTLYMAWKGIARNPIVDLIHKSGECLCGAFSKDSELKELALWNETRPAYLRIKALEDRARHDGLTRCRWGGRKDEDASGAPPGMLCNSCHK